MILAMVDTEMLRMLGIQTIQEAPYEGLEFTTYLQGVEDVFKVVTKCVHGIKEAK